MAAEHYTDTAHCNLQLMHSSAIYRVPIVYRMDAHCAIAVHSICIEYLRLCKYVEYSSHQSHVCHSNKNIRLVFEQHINPLTHQKKRKHPMNASPRRRNASQNAVTIHHASLILHMLIRLETGT